MVRGVNRNIIEVNCTESKYFDKVLLFVDPNCSLSPEKLQQKADRYVKIIVKSGMVSGITAPSKKAISLKTSLILLAGLAIFSALAIAVVIIL